MSIDASEFNNQPQTDNEISPFSNTETLSNFLKQERKPVDYGSIVNPSTKVLTLGEIHVREITKQEVIDNLEQFKELGFTHLGLEAFESDFQTKLDEYQKTGENKQAVVEHIQNGFGGYSPNATGLYLQMLDKAKKLGIHTVAIDMPKPINDKNKSQGLDADSLRDQWMAEMVQKVIDSNDKHKVVTFTGAAHVGKSPQSMSGNLAQNGVEIVTAYLIGGGISTQGAHEIAVSKIGAANERFMVGFHSKAPYDWIIHLPQIERETAIERIGQISSRMKRYRIRRK